ncbi:hypothetical protein F511_21329 [Dorcoceras hygrometricum]|uniref:Uncharacterized protein n=1 Tax=Dorcoceras hygrometricum TaxID=472368 RepID=A0A2Z7B8B6_9LAMI|nr:hypothetical protein F511_21329 [Dorcoceras hygrometricum]
MQGIKATTESREPKDRNNSSTARSDQRNNEFVAMGILSTWELPTHLQYTIPDANNQLHLLLLTHEMWELPTPLIAANKPSRENEVWELPAQPPRYTGTTRSSLNIASCYLELLVSSPMLRVRDLNGDVTPFSNSRFDVSRMTCPVGTVDFRTTPFDACLEAERVTPVSLISLLGSVSHYERNYHGFSVGRGVDPAGYHGFSAGRGVDPAGNAPGGETVKGQAEGGS